MSNTSRDAKFIDDFKPKRLVAQDAEDLAVISALLQDAATLTKDLCYLPAKRRFAFVANRYRWEAPEAEERVRAGAHFDGVLNVKSIGLDRSAKERPLTILSITFEPAEEAPAGVVRISCAPDPETGEAVEIALEIEAIDAALRDMTQPWAARGKPAHEVGADENGEL